MKKYYFAYEDRYKKVHNEGLLWFSDKPTPELLEWVEFNGISIGSDICEIGCGEGRDAIYLSGKGFKITAIDASESAIIKCKEIAVKKDLKVNWIVADALFLDRYINKQYKWVYSIAALHMLVNDIDRHRFLESIYKILEPGGKALLVSKGNGVDEIETDINNAFELQERNHMATGKKVLVACTSYKSINWTSHKKEIEKAGFIIEKAINSENEGYGNCMTAYLIKK